jgi:hypothetical protein
VTLPATHMMGGKNNKIYVRHVALWNRTSGYNITLKTPRTNLKGNRDMKRPWQYTVKDVCLLGEEILIFCKLKL